MGTLVLLGRLLLRLRRGGEQGRSQAGVGGSSGLGVEAQDLLGLRDEAQHGADWAWRTTTAA